MMRAWMRVIFLTSIERPLFQSRRRLGMRSAVMDRRTVTMVWLMMIMIRSGLLLASQQQKVSTIIIQTHAIKQTCCLNDKGWVKAYREICCDGILVASIERMTLCDCYGWIIYVHLIKIKKQSSMITRSAHLIAKTTSLLIKHTPSLLLKPRQPFSKLSDQLRSATYRNYEIKLSNPRFQDSNITMLTYYTQPYIEAKLDFTPKCYQIKESTVLTLNFLSHTAQEFTKQAWENRKTIKLRFKEVMRMLKVDPFSNQVITIQQIDRASGLQEKDYRKDLIVADMSEKKEVEIMLRHISVCPHTKQEDTLWEIKIDIKYEDYTVFQQCIINNMLYTSGGKFSIEITKQSSIQQLDDQIQSIMNDNKQTSKKTPTKGTTKTAKKAKVY